MPTCNRCGAELAPPYQFCARCGAAQGAAPAPPTSVPYPMYPPTPKKNNTLLIVVIILVIFFVATPVIAAILYLMVSGLISGPTSTKPIVTFTSATLQNGIAMFTVAGVTPVVSIDNYRVTLQVDDVGPPTPLPLTTYLTFGISGTTYDVNYTDVSGTRTLKTGDQFRVMSATYGALPAGHTFTFVLIWAADGSAFPTVTWTT